MASRDIMDEIESAKIGEYDVEVSFAELRTGPSGNEYISLTLEHDDGKVYDIISHSPKAAKIAKAKLSVLGIKDSVEDVDPADLVGLKFRVATKLGYKNRPEVDIMAKGTKCGYSPIESEIVIKGPGKATDFDDEILF